MLDREIVVIKDLDHDDSAGEISLLLNSKVRKMIPKLADKTDDEILEKFITESPFGKN